MQGQERRTQTQNNLDGKAMAGAATVAAVAGLCVSGPILAVAAGGTAVYATTRKDKIGEVSRSTGHAVVDAAKGVKKFDEKHRITEKTVNGTKSAIKKAQDINREHKIGERVKDAAVQIGQNTKKAWEGTVQFEKDHKIGENIQKTAGFVCDGTVHMWTETCKFEQDHQIGRKIGTTIAGLGNFLTGKIASGDDSKAEDSLSPRFPSKEEQKWQCNVCREQFMPLSRVTQLPCNHLYHNSCIKKWLDQNSNCPTCRYELQC